MCIILQRFLKLLNILQQIFFETIPLKMMAEDFQRTFEIEYNYYYGLFVVGDFYTKNRENLCKNIVKDFIAKLYQTTYEKLYTEINRKKVFCEVRVEGSHTKSLTKSLRIIMEFDKGLSDTDYMNFLRICFKALFRVEYDCLIANVKWDNQK